MKIKTLLSCVTLFILSGNLSFAQYRINGVSYLPSVQNRNYIKYGGLQSHDLKTGTVFTRVPLYEYNDNDFTIPISIDYASNGYIPSVQSGILGLGWFLNAGGCIIREVKGIPDNSEKGFLDAYLSNNPIDWNTTIAYNRNVTSNTYTTFPDGTETESDVYHFRFLGYSGSFVLDGGKGVYIYDSSHPKGGYEIDLSQLRQDNTITITTGDGYKYIFGGQFQEKLDKTVSTESEFQQNYNLSWVLSRIESPNGRFVAFSYSRPVQNDVYQPVSYYYNESFADSEADWTDEYDIPKQGNELRLAEYTQYDIHLQKINIDDKVTVNFISGAKESSETALSPIKGLRPLSHNSGRLNGINVIDSKNNRTLKTVSFRYSGTKKGNFNTLLLGVYMPDRETFMFNYYQRDAAFPFHGTTLIDHWGYNTSAAQPIMYSPLLPTLTCNSNNIESVTSSEREPNSDAALIGMLQRVTYPTKGYTVFEYEGNSYSLKVDRNNLTQGLPAIMACNHGGFSYGDVAEYPAGGVRLKKITNYSATDESRSIEYFYADRSGNNSGILLHYPRYINGVITKYDSLNIPLYRKIIVRNGTNFFNSFADRYHIEYCSVLEKHPDNSFIEYNFTNYKTSPDELSVVSSAKTLANGNEISVVSPNSAYQYDVKVASNSHLRGRLLERVICNSDGLCVRKVVYDYNYPDQTVSYKSLQRNFSNICLYNENPNDKYLTRETRIDYFGEDSVVRKQHYRYSNSGQIISSINDNSERKIQSITYYADSIASSPFRYISRESTNWNYLNLQKKNYPIGELTFSNGKVIDGKIYYYTLLSNKQGNTYCGLSKIGILKNSCMNVDAIRENAFELELRNDLFGNEGQVLQKTGSNNCVTSYIWGYGGLYVIAEISGVPFDVVRQALGMAKFSDGIYTEDSLSEADEDTLRNIPNSLVKTFTFLPFIGLKSASDYHGDKTSYEYNDGGRLSKITDNNGAVVEEYEYNNGSL